MSKNEIELSELEVESSYVSPKFTLPTTEDFADKMAEIPKVVWILGAIFLSIGAVLLIILIPLAFSYVDYDEYAFKKNTASNSVDSSKVYENGRYFWGINYKPITFKKTYTTVSFTGDGEGDLAIFTEAGLELRIECSFQYRLLKSKLKDLYRNYGTTYHAQVVNVAKSLLKNVAPNYSTTEYYTARQEIETKFFETLRDGLITNVYVNVSFFQLREIVLPGTVAEKLLRTQEQLQINQKEQFAQNATIIRKQTQTLQQNTLANITQIEAEATSEANLILNKADADAFRIRYESKQNAFNTLFDTLGFTTSDQKLSFLYVTGLSDRDNNSTKVFVNMNSGRVNVNV